MDKESVRKKISLKAVITITLSFIALISSLLTIYTYITTSKKISIQCDIISSTNVLDINAEISDLDILYKQSSLKSEKKNLMLIIFRIRNNGNENILKTFFDDKAPFGIKPVVGQVVEKPVIIEASNDYLRNNLDITVDTTGSVYFSDIIFESKESFTFKLLTLVEAETEPKFKVIGKIAGINKNIEIGLIENETELPFFKQVFLGNIWIQLIKSLIYFLIIAFIILVIVIIYHTILDEQEKRKRIKQIKAFKNDKNYTFHYADTVIFEMYKRNEIFNLRSAHNEIKDVEKFTREYKNLTEELEKAKSKNLCGDTRDYEYLKNDYDRLERVITNGFIIKNAKGFVVNDSLAETLDKFIMFTGINKI